MKYESNTLLFSKDIAHMEIKAHNSDNNRWILSVIELDLYFMIIYLCMKYESNTLLFSKHIVLKTIFHSEIKGHNSDNYRWILSVIELDLYLMIIYLFKKYESNAPMYSKVIARKPFLYVRDVCMYVRTDKGDAICPPPPITNGGGIKKHTVCDYALEGFINVSSVCIWLGFS